MGRDKLRRKVCAQETDVVALNDVDTMIHNFDHALKHLNGDADIVYCKVNVSRGPQVKFYRIADPIRKHFHIFCNQAGKRNIWCGLE